MKMEKQSNKTAHLKKETLAALGQSLGVVSTACKAVGIRRERYYDWLKNDTKFAEQVNDVLEVSKDFVESKIYEGIRDGNTALIIFYAKTKMKDRGYVETVANVNVATANNLSALTDEQLDKLIKETEATLARKY